MNDLTHIPEDFRASEPKAIAAELRLTADYRVNESTRADSLRKSDRLAQTSGESNLNARLTKKAADAAEMEPIKLGCLALIEKARAFGEERLRQTVEHEEAFFAGAGCKHEATSLQKFPFRFLKDLDNIAAHFGRMERMGHYSVDGIEFWLNPPPVVAQPSSQRRPQMRELLNARSRVLGGPILPESGKAVAPPVIARPRLPASTSADSGPVESVQEPLPVDVTRKGKPAVAAGRERRPNSIFQ